MIEAQAGPGFVSKKMQSHKDGATSLLHLGLTLGGRRTVRMGTYKRKDFHPQFRDANVFDDNAWEERQRLEQGELHKVNMIATSAYISSPFLFEHGVEYEAAAAGS